MKKVAFFTALILFVISLAACQQNTEREVTATSTTETTTVEPAQVDTAAVNASAADATAATTDAARDAAHKTGTAMETAGQAIQDNTKT
ncbi:MAG TPA: hypothetical protein VND45_11285 [Thermoanaerobaculia bacterium]|jgi:YbbR domain-containing protein|nr:hypothetical protein [Thermoanaerobaculia bacterium]